MLGVFPALKSISRLKNSPREDLPMISNLHFPKRVLRGLLRTTMTKCEGAHWSKITCWHRQEIIKSWIQCPQRSLRYQIWTAGHHLPAFNQLTSPRITKLILVNLAQLRLPLLHRNPIISPGFQKILQSLTGLAQQVKTLRSFQGLVRNACRIWRRAGNLERTSSCLRGASAKIPMVEAAHLKEAILKVGLT
jgi:hypothetical protein